jgi:hypothetical protein
VAEGRGDVCCPFAAAGALYRRAYSPLRAGVTPAGAEEHTEDNCKTVSVISSISHPGASAGRERTGAVT